MIRPAHSLRTALGALALLLLAGLGTAHAQTLLADQPLFGTSNVPGNLALALSVEFPTAVTAADRSTTYSTTQQYLGYFDPLKCYTYVFGSTNGNYFDPDVNTPASSAYACGTGKWSGNFLNWATMQAVDPFRWALTGGYRSVDTTTTTILEKAVAPSNQGSSGNNFPHKTLTTGVSNATPFSSTMFAMQVLRCGNKMLFRLGSSGYQSDGGCPSYTPWDGVTTPTAGIVYSIDVRVLVCKIGGPEANCVKYGSNYKPEGLIQKYAQKIRYSAFGYLLDPTPTGGSDRRDGGVLRARMKFVAPTQPVPGSLAIANPAAEWSATTGVFVTNPDTVDALASTVTNSGVINYLNQFGLTSGAYKYYDPVSELYYAVSRYLRNKGDVPEYSSLLTYNGGTATLANQTSMKDGFPVITGWVDPILYSCQKNFILGIGDTNSNQDKDVPGNTAYRTEEPTMPSSVAADNIDALAATNKVGVIEGIGSGIGNTNNYNSSNNSAYIAGLAYLMHTTDIRPDLTGNQTVSTYWLDVLEGSDYKAGPAGRNQFYLAAKYGGFSGNDPSSYSYANNTTALSQTTWSTNTDTLPGLGARPDNYFVANQADKMVAGLNSAFSAISAATGLFTTGLATTVPQLTSSGNANFSSNYDANTWTGEVTASSLSFDSNGNATAGTTFWTFSNTLASQIGGTGWRPASTGNASRRVVTWNGSQGVVFTAASGTQMDATDLLALDTAVVTGNDYVNYLNYLRGDRSNEILSSSGSTTTGSATGVYRARSKLVGDIIGSKVTVVGPPVNAYSDTTNPGYSAFVAARASRRTVAYVGANDGMLHAINGATLTSASASFPTGEVDTLAGTEMFAYVPRAVIKGPNNTPQIDGLASLATTPMAHHYFVNATPQVFDIDFNKTSGASGSPDWHSVLIGGLGKGGKAYYAIDVTDPQSMVSGGESAVAAKVLWEFSDPALGFSYGDPVVVKTKKWGWTVVFFSGYNNTDGKGYFIFVNPKTGARLGTAITTGEGSLLLPAGMAQGEAFIVDGTDGTADAIYAGDLLGNLWRLDVTSTGTFPAPLKIARLTDSLGVAQPVTTKPLISVHPSTRKRYVFVGTGRLLDSTDIASIQMQSFYSIIDGTNASFNTIPLVSPLAYPLTRSMLFNQTTNLSTNPTVGAAIDSGTQMGWYIDLGLDIGIPTTGIAYRQVSSMTSAAGAVGFSSTLPNGQVCSPDGSSRIYGLDYSNGSTVINTVSGTVKQPVATISVTGVVTNLNFVSVTGSTGNATLSLVGTTNQNQFLTPNVNQLSSYRLRRINWRELQVVD